MADRFQELLQAVEDAERRKREFVSTNPKGCGDRELRLSLYNQVEKARMALRHYKRMNPHLDL